MMFLRTPPTTLTVLNNKNNNNKKEHVMYRLLIFKYAHQTNKKLIFHNIITFRKWYHKIQMCSKIKLHVSWKIIELGNYV